MLARPGRELTLSGHSRPNQIERDNALFAGGFQQTAWFKERPLGRNGTVEWLTAKMTMRLEVF